MHFAVLGSLEVRTPQQTLVRVPGAKERLLLAVLLSAAPGAVADERLQDAVWEGAPPPTARKSLQAHVVRLRSALEPDRPTGSSGRYVARRGGGYALSVDRDEVDALRLGELAARGRAHVLAGDPGRAVDELAVARTLWRGEPYADWPDATFADVERRRLCELRVVVDTGLLEAQLALGHHADVLPDLEALVTRDPLREGWWRLLMLALYRDGRQADALAAGRRARTLLAEELGVDPGPALRSIETAILGQDPLLDLPTAPGAAVRPSSPRSPEEPWPSSIERCPYLGLAAYQPADAALFHGRSRLVAGLVRRLAESCLLVVSGPSGAGKSSLVRAGLLPALAGSALPGSAGWRPVILAPGPQPVDVLAGLTGESPPSGPVVLVCDQLEELWAPAVEAAERTAFLDALLGLLDDGIVERCIAVVRGDHVGRLAEHPTFIERLGGALVLVTPPTEAELRELVTEPARSVGLSVEPALLDAVAADVVGESGALPLLSTALVGTWAARHEGRLTLAGYLAVGGVAGALTRSAEATYAGLGEQGQAHARRLLVRLADVDSGGVLVRRQVPLAELDLDHVGPGSPDTSRAVVEAFVARRLLTVDAGRVEVAHEALLTTWPRLARWLEDDAAGRAVRRKVAPAALDWDAGGRPGEDLWRGARLSAALDWAGAAGAEPTPVERVFLRASQERAEAELHKAQRQVLRETSARRRTRSLALGLAVVLVLALAAAGAALGARRAADARAADAVAAATAADANRLAARSAAAESVDLSLLLAAQAVRLGDTPETQDGLLAALVNHRKAVRAVPVPGRSLGSRLADGGKALFIGVGQQVASWAVGPSSLPGVAFDLGPGFLGWSCGDGSPVEDVLAMAGENRDGPWVRLRAADGSSRLDLVGDVVGGTPLDVAFSADGRRLSVLVATGAGRWSLRDVDVAAGSAHDTGVTGELPSGAGMRADFSDDGSTAVVWNSQAALRVESASGRRVGLQLSTQQGSLRLVALPAGTAQLRTNGGITRYDVTGRPVQQLEAHRAPVRDLAVSADGSFAASGGDGGTVLLWDIDPRTGAWSQREPLVAQGSDIVSLALDPTGRRLFSVSVDGVVVWDVSGRSAFGGAYPGLAGRWIANRPQRVTPGGLVVAPTRSLSRLGGDPRVLAPDTLSVAATFFDANTGRVVDEVVVGTTFVGPSLGASVAVSPDGRRVAVTSGLATTVLDSTTRAVLATVTLPPTGDVDGDGQPLPAQEVWCAGWTPDGSRLLIGAEGKVADDSGGSLVVVDATTWAVQRRVPMRAPQAMELSPDGRTLALVGSGRPELLLLDATTLQVRRTLPLSDRDVALDLSFSPDGSRLALGGQSGLLYVFDTATWRLLRAPDRVHDEDLLQVEWLPDGRNLVSSGKEGSVALYDTSRGLVRARLPASDVADRGYTHLVPSATGEIIALSGEREGRRYPTDPTRWLAEACAVAGRDLTEAEWSRYLSGRPRQATCSDLS